MAEADPPSASISQASNSAKRSSAITAGSCSGPMDSWGFGRLRFLLWQVAEDLDALVELQTALNRTRSRRLRLDSVQLPRDDRRSIYEFQPPRAGARARLVIQPSAAITCSSIRSSRRAPGNALPKPGASDDGRTRARGPEVSHDPAQHDVLLRTG